MLDKNHDLSNIEMLDQLITYIVWWYKIVYQVLSVAWTNRITTRRYRDS
jgi:hypothetical protein